MPGSGRGEQKPGRMGVVGKRRLSPPLVLFLSPPPTSTTTTTCTACICWNFMQAWTKFTIRIFCIQFIFAVSCPRKLVIAAAIRHSIVPYSNNLFVSIHYAGSNLWTRILASLCRQERDGHEILVPAQVVCPLAGCWWSTRSNIFHPSDFTERGFSVFIAVSVLCCCFSFWHFRSP